MSQVVITGCSSGVGMYLSIILAEAKYKVYATMRDLSKDKELREEAKKRNVEDKISILELDVTSDSSTKKCFDEIFKREGRFDFLINNAGFSIPGTLEQITSEDCLRQFDTNVFGVARCCKQVLPVMRKQKSGRVIAISSVGGVSSSPFNDIYCSSKFAVEGMFESMAPLYKNFGVHCCVVEPGAIVTKFVETAMKNSSTTEDPELVRYREIYMSKVLKQFADPKLAQTGEQVAEKIKAAMEDPFPKFRYQTNPAYSAHMNKLSDPTGVVERETIFNRYFAN